MNTDLAPNSPVRTSFIKRFTKDIDPSLAAPYLDLKTDTIRKANTKPSPDLPKVFVALVPFFLFFLHFRWDFPRILLVSPPLSCLTLI